MLSQPQEWDAQGVSQMSRAELIAGLLEFNEVSSFQFSAAWLNRQWTSRLRSLLRATRRQRRAREEGASVSQGA